eukprot:265662-Chlamydomonas_euryale.AAC.1
MASRGSGELRPTVCRLVGRKEIRGRQVGNWMAGNGEVTYGRNRPRLVAAAVCARKGQQG